MVRKVKKGDSGSATNYVSRGQALRKLQLSLKDFRRLCILKGIYPHEPKHMKKVNKGSTALKTYYYAKDIKFLSHEPLIQKFRQFKIFARKLRSAIAKRDRECKTQVLKGRPVYKLDHLVKERYPTFTDALRDMDDILCMCFLFTTFPASSVVGADLVALCRRLSIEFLHFVIESRSLRKCFISIKGFYFQADVQGYPIVWVTPHQFGFHRPKDVDFKIMATFVEFYTTMLGFINYKLYHTLNLHYPPKLSVGVIPKEEEKLLGKDDAASERVTALNQSLNRILVSNVENEVEIDEFIMSEDPAKIEEHRRTQARIKKLQTLFNGLRFFLSREVPREPFVFVIRSFGGEVSWDRLCNVGATYQEDDLKITHHILDRKMAPKSITSRYYVQPQWVFDCANQCTLLPVEDYFPGVVLPPHLSPFVEENEDDYVPPERQVFLDRQAGKIVEEETGDSESEQEDVQADVSPIGKKRTKQQNRGRKRRKVAATVEPGRPQPAEAAKAEAEEQRRLAVMMIPKKQKRLYQKIMEGKRKTAQQARVLTKKRAAHDLEQKNLKKNTKKTVLSKVKVK